MATIKDVARLAGVGLGTASRAISGRGPVSADALARVNEAIAALEFRPSNVARALSLKSLGMIGIYVPDFAGSFYGPILQTVDAVLRTADLHMVAANGCGQGDARQQALDGIQFLIQRECDGVLAMSHDLHDADLHMLFARQPRLVVLNRLAGVRPEHCFSTDHDLAGRLAARALLARGHREIAVIAGPRDAPDNEARMRGFHAELALHKVRVLKKHQVEGDFGFDGGHAAAQALLARATGEPRRFTALFCANDVMAMAALACLARAGVNVPGDVSVLGFDDSELARYTSPGLTTVRVPIERTAANGCRFLMNLCYGFNLPVQREFSPQVVWRDSVAPGPHAPVFFDPLPGEADIAAHKGTVS